MEPFGPHYVFSLHRDHPQTGSSYGGKGEKGFQAGESGFSESFGDVKSARCAGDAGDREKAMSLLDESLAISSELGMRPLKERVLSRREILGA